ncbi:MAG: hypothetical protein ACRDPR_08875, partial [Nocardioidaceae bacterium]
MRRLVGGSHGRRGVFVVLLAASLLAALTVTMVTTSSAAPVITPDENGPNDAPGQRDLTMHVVDNAGLPTSIGVGWNWDTTGLSGGNTGDACALFDTDNDAKVNFAVCATIGGDPATLTNTRIYSCTDTRVDRCVGSTLQPLGSTTCS